MVTWVACGEENLDHVIGSVGGTEYGYSLILMHQRDNLLGQHVPHEDCNSPPQLSIQHGMVYEKVVTVT